MPKKSGKAGDKTSNLKILNEKNQKKFSGAHGLVAIPATIEI